MISTIPAASKTAMKTEEMLRNAKNHCFFVGLNDSGAELCRANSLYGIAGIHYVQNQLGMTPNATFISTPDMTITRQEMMTLSFLMSNLMRVECWWGAWRNRLLLRV
ncbi:MAG: hypothetical protein ACYS19_14505 [Planctomycetota bacterium]|jgi:hypothetical protein